MKTGWCEWCNKFRPEVERVRRRGTHVWLCLAHRGIYVLEKPVTAGMGAVWFHTTHAIIVNGKRYNRGSHTLATAKKRSDELRHDIERGTLV